MRWRRGHANGVLAIDLMSYNIMALKRRVDVIIEKRHLDLVMTGKNYVKSNDVYTTLYVYIICPLFFVIK